MSHPRRLAPLRLGAAGLLALALAGCGAGLDPQTYQTRTVADATNANLGTLSVRNLAVRPPAGGRVYAAGKDARGTFTVTNTGAEPDVLLEITSSAASEVVLLSGGAPKELEVPARGTTGSAGGFLLRGLTSDVGTGEVVSLTMRFERAGTLEAIVPVQTSGRTDRPAFTGEPGSEEGEPALQGPAGGHHEDEAEAEQEGASEPTETEPTETEATVEEPVEEPASS